MARTPLLRSLRNLFVEHHVARSRGVTVAQLRDERQASPTTRSGRRAFLAAAGAGAVTLGTPSLWAAKKASPVVAIVGGGIAGLTCALKLADRGIAATVYEASARPGGRMFSNMGSYWGGGQVSEWCGELIDTGHKTVQQLAQRFGLPLDDLLAAEPAGSEDTYRILGGYYPKAQADLDFAPVAAAATADLKAAGYPTAFDGYTAAGLALDQMSVHDWIETRVPGGHASPLGALLDLAYVIEFGADADEQSALNLLYLLAYQPSPKGLAMFGESDERFHIRGGNERLPQAIAQSLGNLQYGHGLTRIAQTAAGRYDLHFDVGPSATTVTADLVVLALPFAVLRDLDYAQAGFDALKNTAIQTLGSGHNGKLQLQFSSRLWAQTGPWPGISNGSTYSDTGYQSGWEVTRGQPGATGIMNLYSGGSVTDAMLTQTAFATTANAQAAADAAAGLTRLSPVFPGVGGAFTGKGTQSLPHLSPFFKASYAFYRTGQYTTFGGYEGATQGGVYFCGEHTSVDFQGYMEGGAITGKQTARALAKVIRGWDDGDDAV